MRADKQTDRQQMSSRFLRETTQYACRVATGHDWKFGEESLIVLIGVLVHPNPSGAAENVFLTCRDDAVSVYLRRWGDIV